MKITGNEPAFPCNSPDGIESYKGMTLKQFYAGLYIIDRLHDERFTQATFSFIADEAVKQANALIKALNEEKSE